MKTTIGLSLLLSSSCVTAFSPASFGGTSTCSSSSSSSCHSKSNSAASSSALHVSVVRDIISQKVIEENRKSNKSHTKKHKKKSSDDALLKAFESLTPESVGVQGPGIQTQRQAQTSTTRSSSKGSRKQAQQQSTQPAAQQQQQQQQKPRRKHNFRERSLLQEEPDLDFFTLHSSAVSHLHKDMPVNDIVRAIKRAQNLHDVHDLATIGAFLMDHCDEHWGFGYRGSLLSRLAVAALHCSELDIAARALETRRVEERPSMQALESAAIVRGLMRVGNIEEGWEVLNDELKLPMNGMLEVEKEKSQDVIKHRARTLASIASRHFYQGEPYVAAKALLQLGELGDLLSESSELLTMDSTDLKMPWSKLVTASTVCSDIVIKNGWDVKHIDGTTSLPQSDLADLVWDTMYRFPCPGDEEECSLEDFMAETS